jgi:hypothetical protein
MYGHSEILNEKDILVRLTKLLTYYSKDVDLKTVKAYFPIIQHLLSIDMFNRGLPLDFLKQYFPDIDFSDYKDENVTLTTFLEMIVFNQVTQHIFKNSNMLVFALDPQSNNPVYVKYKPLINKTVNQNHPDGIIVVVDDHTLEKVMSDDSKVVAQMKIIKKVMPFDVKLRAEPEKHLPVCRPFYSITPEMDFRSYVASYTGSFTQVAGNNKASNDPNTVIVQQMSTDLINIWKQSKAGKKSPDFLRNKQLKTLFYGLIKDFAFHKDNILFLPSIVVEAAQNNDWHKFMEENKQEMELAIKEAVKQIDLADIFQNGKFDVVAYDKVVFKLIKLFPKSTGELLLANYFKVRELTHLIDDV